MAINYPTSLDSLTNPLSTDLLTSPAHSTQHSNVNDAVEALEAKVGADASAVTTSHDYKLGEVTGTDKAVGKTATQTLTNKTLTAPQINMGSDATGDTYYRTAGGAFARLPIGTSGQILQSNASSIPEWIANPSAADASTTVKGVVEEATLAETLARTTAGGTSARLFVNPSTLTSVQTYDYAASSGGTDTYAITVTPAPTAYVTGQVFRFKADVANTGACTLNVNSLGAKSIKKNVSAELETGDIIANQVVEVIYDGTNFQLNNRVGSGLTRLAGYDAAADTNENTVYTTTVPAGLLGLRGGIFIKTPIYFVNGSSGGTYTLRLKYGGSTLSTMVITKNAIGGAAAVQMQGTIDAWIINNAATNSQFVGFYGNVATQQTGTGTSHIGIEVTTQPADTTSAIDTTADQTLTMTVQKSSGSIDGSDLFYQTIVETKLN